MARLWAKLGFAATLGAALFAGQPGYALSPDDARHLLARSGLGATAAEIARLAPLSREAAVDRLLAETRTAPSLPPPAFLSQPWPRYRDLPDMREEERQPFIQARRAELQTLKAWWYAEMIATPSPLTERMTLFWHNHFVSNFDGVGFNVHRVWNQHALFRREAAGSFAVLVYEILRDPVMLRYLDNTSNRKGRPNENLARELLELFTLGEGNYAEKDVKEIARALTGRTVERTTDYGFRFVAGMHDEGGKNFLGANALNGDDVARVLLEQKRTAAFVAEKLWREFVSTEPPPASEIAAIATALRDNGYEMKPALRRLFLSGAFWAPENRGALIKAPAVLIAGLHRDLGLPVVDLQALPVHGRRLGQDLFEPPNVKGWPGGETWITPANLVARYDVLSRLLDNRGLAVPAAPEPGGHIAMRVAGDAWQGLPRMVVTINGGTKIAERDIEFATDSARYGNLPDRNDWTWRVLRFPVGEPVESVAVAFVNDGAAPPDANGVRRGDRNLFVDWIEADGRMYAARDGKQASPGGACPNARPGDLFCGGTLTLDVAALKSAGKGQPVDGAEAKMDAAMAPSMAPTMAPARAAKSSRAVYLDAAAWLKDVPRAWQAPAATWRALAPLPPVGAADGTDAESRVRAVIFDPVYELM